MNYILFGLGMISSVFIHVFCHWYTSWWNILTFIGMTLACTIAWLIIYFGILFVSGLFCNKKKETKFNSFFRWIFVETDKICLHLVNVHIHVEGKEKIPKGQKYLMVSNHLSNYDPMSILRTFSKDKIIFVSKPENFNIPMVGAMMHRAGFMAIDRDNVRNAIVTINKAADYIKNDTACVFIFPEGTRNRTQKPLLEFRNGAFKIATKAGCPLVIVSVAETEKVKHNIPRRSDVYVKVLDVIPAEKVKEMRTADISEYAWKLIYDATTHGIKEETKINE